MHSPAVVFDARALRNELARLTPARRFLVAYSGGLDSHVLLHALASAPCDESPGVRAIHVDHALVPASAQWPAHCRSVCAALGCDLDEQRVTVSARAGESPEQAARRVRYAAFVSRLRAGEELLTAHTVDDQAETLLLRLLRGAGVEGAGAIRWRRPLGEGWVTRPVLGFERAQLAAYAARHGLRWIEDPSNRDTRLDRNFLRQRVLPLLRERWPATGANLARSAGHFAAAARLLEAQANADLAACAPARDGSLPLAGLLRLDPDRQDLVLRRWLRQGGALAPSSVQLAAIRAMPQARADRVPRVRWGEWVVSRYRQALHLDVDPGPGGPACLAWDLRDPLAIPGRAAPLTRDDLTACGLTLAAGRAVEVRFRRGGERIRLAGRGCTKTLKKLFQEAGVPPWERARVPLIYVDGRLAAVIGIGVAQAFAGGARATG